MGFSVGFEIHYVPLPPEKKYAYDAALSGLYAMLAETMEEIDEEERERGKEKQDAQKKREAQ